MDTVTNRGILPFLAQDGGSSKKDHYLAASAQVDPKLLGQYVLFRTQY